MTEEKKVPDLRFPGFTDPWEQRKLGTLSQRVIVGLATSVTQYYRDAGVPILRNLNIKENRLDDEDILYLDEDYAKSQISKQIHTGDVLTVHTGYIGTSCVVPEKYDNCLTFTTLVTTTDSSKLKGEFLAQYLNSESGMSAVQTVTTQGGRQNLNTNDFVKVEIPYPSIPEQEKICEALRNLDTLITLHQRKVDDLKTMKTCLLQKMFPKEGENTPELRFPGFTDPWEQRKFSDVVEIGSGMDYKHLGEGDIPVYGTGGYMLSVDAALSEDKDAIGIGRKGTIDKPYILRAPFWTVDTLFYCIPKENYDLDFTNCLFQNVDWKKKDESTGVPSLSKVIINNVETAAPSFDEQKKIGEYFKGIDNLITLHQRKVDDLKTMKKCLLQKMFI